MNRFLTTIGIIALLLVLLIAGGGVWVHYAFLDTEPLTEAELAELTPDWDVVTRGNWSPWYDAGDGTKKWNPAASYNAWSASVPEGDKAWPILAEAELIDDELYRHEALGVLPSDSTRWNQFVSAVKGENWDTLATQLRLAYSKPVLGAGLSRFWTPAQHAAFVRYMEHDTEAFDPGPLEFDPQENISLLEAMMPWIGSLSNLAKFSVSRAAYELESGNKEQYLADVELLLKASDLVSEGPLLLSNLVEIDIESKTMKLIEWGLVSYGGSFTEADLSRIEEALQIQDRETMPWNGEALAFHDAMRRLATPSGGLGSRSTEEIQSGDLSLGDPISISVEKLQPSLQGVLLVYNRILKAAGESSRVPWEETQISPDEILANAQDKLNHIGTLYLKILAPATERASVRFREHRQAALALRTAIAAHRHRLRHGAFPDSIDAIDEDLIAFDPIDAFTGQQLGYTLSEEGPIVYSYGPDRMDNNGLQLWIEHIAGDDSVWYTKPEVNWLTADEAKSVYGSGEHMQGDWVLFPMPVDDPKPLEDQEADDYDPDWDLKQGGNYEDVYREEPAPQSDG